MGILIRMTGFRHDVQDVLILRRPRMAESSAAGMTRKWDSSEYDPKIKHATRLALELFHGPD